MINLDETDLDRYIYRIYAKDRFLVLLSNKVDAVVNPSKWEDPFEDFFLERTEVFDPVSQSTIPLKNLAHDWYGQCWSHNSDTDAMWGIYSPDPAKSVGVKVRTTIRKLFDNMKAFGSTAPELQFFVGNVTYHTEDGIRDLMSRLTFSDVAIGDPSRSFAELLCIKRTAFQHEAEVRLLYQDVEFPNQSKRGQSGVFSYPLDPANVFDEVVLDPRLKDCETLSITSDLVAAGCKLPISRSSLYDAPRFVIST